MLREAAAAEVDAAAAAEVDAAAAAAAVAVAAAEVCATANAASEALRAWDLSTLLEDETVEPLSWTLGSLRAAIVGRVEGSSLDSQD